MVERLPRDRDQHVYVGRVLNRIARLLYEIRCCEPLANGHFPQLADYAEAGRLIIAECEAGRILSGYARRDGMIMPIPHYRWGSDDADDFLIFGQIDGFPIFLDRACLEKFETTLSKSITAPHSRRLGRPTAYDWSSIKAEVLRLMAYHGEFANEDPAWNAQARLEEAIQQFSQSKWQREPATSAIRAKLKVWLPEWRRQVEASKKALS